MPRLPDKETLGGLPSLRSGRQYASAGEAKEDVSGQEAASQALVKGFHTLAGSVEKIAAEEVQQEDALDLIKANAAHAERLRDLNNTFDTDPDWRTYRPRYADSATQITADAAAGIRSPKLRSRWIEQANERNSSAMDRVLDRGTRLQKEEKEVEIDGVLERYRKMYASAPDDDTRRRILDDIDVAVTAGQRTGLLDMSRGEAKRRSALDSVLREDAERRLLSGDSVAVMRDLGALRDPTAKRPGPRFKPEVQIAIDTAADKYGVDADMLATFARIESGGDPSAVTGSYRGLFQLSKGEFAKTGVGGSIFDPVANSEAAAIKLKAEMATFEAKYGRPATATEIYLIHQQGEGGFDAHNRNPEGLAWKNMASTAEGRQKGEKWAKAAIWGNIPDDQKEKFGSVENVTSLDFMGMWGDKVRRLGGEGGAPAGPYSRMSFSARHALVTRAKIAMSAETQQDLKDAYQEIIDNGEAARGADGSTAIDRARLFLQPNQVKKAELLLDEARALHQAVTPLRRMTEEQAVEHLRQFQDANATGERAALARKVSRAAEAAWEEVQKERMTDPAEAVDPFRNVRTQKAGRTRRADEVAGAYDLIKRRYPNVNVRETVAGGYEIMDPQDSSPEAMAETHKARRALIDARIMAQTNLGIPTWNRQPISRREADEILQLPENVNQMTPAQYRMKLQEAADRAEMKYGRELGPIVVESALTFRKPGDAEHKDHADRLIGRLARGDRTGLQGDLRRLIDLQTLGAPRFVFPSVDDYARGRQPYSSPSPEEGRRALPSPPPGPTTPAARLPSLAPPQAVPDERRALGGRPMLDKPEPRRTQRGYHDRVKPEPNPFDADDAPQ